MKKALITCRADPREGPWWDVYQLARERFIAYAAAHGYEYRDFWYDDFDAAEWPGILHGRLPVWPFDPSMTSPCWLKIPAINVCLREYDQVVYFDNDCVILDFSKDIADALLPDKWLAMHEDTTAGGTGPNIGVVVTSACEQSRKFWRAAWDSDAWETADCTDQSNATSLLGFTTRSPIGKVRDTEYTPGYHTLGWEWNGSGNAPGTVRPGQRVFHAAYGGSGRWKLAVMRDAALGWPLDEKRRDVSVRARRKQMKLGWLANNEWTPGAGNGYCVHSRKLKESVIAAGVEVTVDPKDDYDLGVYVMRPDRFFPAPGKPSICFSACEMDRPTAHLSSAPTALCVPCSHNRRVWAPFFRGPIEVVPEGFCELMTYAERRKPAGADEMFVYLWHGNDFFGNRKGSGVITKAWRDWHASGRMPDDAVLWMKTSEIQGREVRFYNASLDEEFDTLQVPGVVTDVRHLPIAEMVKLYQDSSAFISTSSGEGWCLPAADAAACGLPVIYPEHSAFMDYLNAGSAYPLTELDQVPYWPLGVRAGDGPPEMYGLWPRETDIIRAMEDVYQNYDEALERGRRASAHMNSQFAWAQAAEKFIRICERYV